MKRVVILALLAPVSLAVAATGSAASTAAPSLRVPPPLTGRVLVLLAAPTGTTAHAAAAHAFLARTGARAAGPEVPEIGLVTVDLPAAESFSAFARRLRRDPAVRSVALERRMSPRLAPNDPALITPELTPGTPVGTPLQWAPQREGLPAAWDVTRGDGALVGVIDTGVDAGHPELAGKLAAAVDQDALPGEGPPTVDLAGHGTHVASLACANTGNGLGMAGIGFNCRLIVEKSDFSDSSIAASIVDATKRGAQAINMSFGDDGSRGAVQAIVDAVDYAYRHNVVLVAAAADEQIQEQGQPPNLLQPTGTGPQLTQGKGLSVTSANYADGPSGGGYGSQISLAAYGSFAGFQSSVGPRGLFAAFPGNNTDIEQGSVVPFMPPCGCRTALGGDNRYAYLKGTSMAAPQVAAVAALIANLNRELTNAEVLRILKQTARRPAGAWTPELGWGILDARAAVATARRIDHRPPTSKLSTVRSTRRRTFRLRWTGNDPARSGVVASGIDYYLVYASRNGRAFKRITRTRSKTRVFTGVRGSRYRFFTIAVDRAGNREPRPARPDATTRVL